MQTTNSESIEEIAVTQESDAVVPSESTTSRPVNNPTVENTAGVVTTTVKKEEPVKKNYDLSNVAVGITVYHAKFGKGKVANIDKARKYIRVSFSIGEKTFVMPSCFVDGFLKLEQ